MRIEILGVGTGSVTQLQSGLDTLHSRISDTINDLRDVKRKMNNLPGGLTDLSGAYQNVDKRIRKEESRLTAVERLSRAGTSFLNNTVSTDNRVARLVDQNQEKFFRSHAWLRPVVKEEKSWWEQRLEDWNNFWGDVGEKLKDAWDSVASWVQEHWRDIAKVVIGVVAIAIGAALIVLSGGGAIAFGAAFLMGLKAAAITAVVSGVISGTVMDFQGKNVLDAFGQGLLNGFMLGGISFAAGAAALIILGQNFLVNTSLWSSIRSGAKFGGLTNLIASPASTTLSYFFEHGTLEGALPEIVFGTLIGVISGTVIGGAAGGVKFLWSEHHLRSIERGIMDREDLSATQKGKEFERAMLKEADKRLPDLKKASQCRLESDQLLNKNNQSSYQMPDLLVENPDHSFKNYDFKWGSAGKTYNQKTLTGGGSVHQFNTIITHSRTNFSTNVVPAGTPFIEMHPSIFDTSQSLNAVIGVRINPSSIIDQRLWWRASAISF